MLISRGQSSVCKMAAKLPVVDDPPLYETVKAALPRRQYGGGYDCEFVTAPPDAVQTECPVCLRIPKEPCLISCTCGHKVCRECVEGLKAENRPCPLCKSDFTFIRDYGLEKFLMEQEVWCSQKKIGCKWMGKLAKFEEHLKYPTPVNQLSGCQFLEVECINNCGEWLQRRLIAEHQDHECRKRRYSCDYCQGYVSTYEDVTSKHHNVCGKYPVTCPNQCRDTPFERREMKNHLEIDCPLKEIRCPFHYAGCRVKLPRKEMAEHMKEMMAAHLTLLATVTHKLLQVNQGLQENCATLEDKLQATEGKVEAVEEEVHELNRTLGGFPIDFRVNFFNKEGVFLPSFYSHPHGYRMGIKVYPNGVAEGSGTHISIFAYVMRGSYDYHLKWPFRGVITIQIVNQAGDHDHFKATIEYNMKMPEVYQAVRVAEGRMSGSSWGKKHFLSHKELEGNAARNIQYLKDGVIIVRVLKVKTT